jgi:hypothetical protein
MKVTVTYRPNAHARFRPMRAVTTMQPEVVDSIKKNAIELFAALDQTRRDNGYAFRVVVDNQAIYDSRKH